jgi:uncharacterized membrane protein
VAIFPLFKKKPFFTADEQLRIVDAIRSCEKQTSGEIRVFVESKNPLMDPVERAKEVFFNLKMQETDHRNGVLLYMATKHKEIALFGDEGIYKATGADYWNGEVRKMISRFKNEQIVDGVVKCVREVGETLKEKFPYIPTEDKNELPDDIVFGK